MLVLIQAALLWGLLISGCDGAPVDDDSLRWLGRGKPGREPASPLEEAEVHALPKGRPNSLDDPHAIDGNDQGADVDMVDVKRMAMMTSIVYCHNETTLRSWMCPTCRDPLINDFVVHDVVAIKSWQLFGYIGHFPATNAKAIFFRGTNERSLWNWVEDLRADRKAYPLGIPESKGAYVHSGFYSMWNDSGIKARMTMALASLIEKTKRGGPLYVAGHSMGAAIASMCAIYMKYIFDLPDVRVYTYGSPRVGNTKFVKLFNKMVSVSVRVTHMEDIVPSVPVRWMGYHHVPREVWQLDHVDPTTKITSFRFKACDNSGEDPHCHDSVCHWGICRSIPNHLKYLGYTMRHDFANC